jgi:hypothetical protein
MACPPLADLTAQSANHIADWELCLYLLGCAKSCSVLHDKGECAGKTTMKETTDENSAQLGARFVDAVAV